MLSIRKTIVLSWNVFFSGLMLSTSFRLLLMLSSQFVIFSLFLLVFFYYLRRDNVPYWSLGEGVKIEFVPSFQPNLT